MKLRLLALYITVALVLSLQPASVLAEPAQAGAFASRLNAENMVESLRSRGIESSIKTKVVKGKSLYVVVLDSPERPVPVPVEKKTPNGKADQMIVTVRAEVEVYERPEAGAKSLGTYGGLGGGELRGSIKAGQWIMLRLPSGALGYVRAADVSFDHLKSK